MDLTNNSSSSKKRRAKASTKVPTPKRTCRPSSIEPDVAIVVGGVEYYEHSSFLCSWSEYFDTALRSGMKETKSKRFEFPDRDPKEWEFVVELMAPLTKVSMDKDNIRTALSWFDELCCDLGMGVCDGALLEQVKNTKSYQSRGIEKGSQYDALSLDLEEAIFPNLSAACRYNLQECSSLCINILQRVLRTYPFVLTKEHLKVMAECMKGHESCRTRLWCDVMAILPASIS